jgi:hypothetical protein
MDENSSEHQTDFTQVTDRFGEGLTRTHPGPNIGPGVFPIRVSNYFHGLLPNIATPSCIDLDLMNPYYFLWITLGMSSCSLLVRILVRILTEVFRREICLKSETFTMLSCLGTKVM